MRSIRSLVSESTREGMYAVAAATRRRRSSRVPQVLLDLRQMDVRSVRFVERGVVVVDALLDTFFSKAELEILEQALEDEVAPDEHGCFVVEVS